MKRLLLILFCFPLIALGQEPEIDKLELLYAQGHYKKVNRGADKLLAIPYYDYSSLPKLYKAMAITQLYQTKKFKKKNPDTPKEVLKLLREFKSQDVQGTALEAHIIEFSDIYGKVERMFVSYFGEEKAVKYLNELFPGSPSTSPPKVKVEVDTSETITVTKSEMREAIIVESKSLLGVPYKYGGTTKKGFDCSGYTGYVFKKEGLTLPRRAEDQYHAATKIKRKDLLPGDLVFFSNNGKVNHVGIVLKVEGGDVFMIHASTSKGISIVNIDESTYWSPRIKGFGRVIAS